MYAVDSKWKQKFNKIDGNSDGNNRKQKLATLLFSAETICFHSGNSPQKPPWKQPPFSRRGLFRGRVSRKQELMAAKQKQIDHYRAGNIECARVIIAAPEKYPSWSLPAIWAHMVLDPPANWTAPAREAA